MSDNRIWAKLVVSNEFVFAEDMVNPDKDEILILEKIFRLKRYLLKYCKCD